MNNPRNPGPQQGNQKPNQGNQQSGKPPMTSQPTPGAGGTGAVPDRQDRQDDNRQDRRDDRERVRPDEPKDD